MPDSTVPAPGSTYEDAVTTPASRTRRGYLPSKVISDSQLVHLWFGTTTPRPAAAYLATDSGHAHDIAVPTAYQ